MHVYYRVGGELAFTTSGVSSSGFSGSALRFGLMDIKPLQVVETIKKFGMKFRRVTRTFESLNPSKSYTDLVYFGNEAIFGTIEIPKWFDAEKLIRAYSKRSIQNYEKDKELQREVEKMRESKRKGRPLLSFTQFMIERFESKRDNYLEMEAHRFLNSNLPLSFYNKLVVLDNTFYNFLKVVEEIVRMHEFLADRSRSFPLYSKRIEKMKRIISPLIDQLDKCYHSNSCLKKYVSIWNTRDYEEIFYPKFLDIKKLDFSVFEELSENASMRLRETREFLLRYSPDLLHKKLDLKDPTTKMFGKLVMLPQSSYRLES